jgi:hypothetical protein
MRTIIIKAVPVSDRATSTITGSKFELEIPDDATPIGFDYDSFSGRRLWYWQPAATWVPIDEWESQS